jgi:uncharacterized protein (TIGR02996 family)
MEPAFLRAICESPDDDTPRLVYADWLEEHGGQPESERAEFIRGQVQLARLNDWDEGATELSIRCRYLLRAHRDEWLAPLADIPTNPWFWDDWHTFSRGFVERLEMAPAAFLEHADRLANLAPIRGLAVHPPWHGERAIPEVFWWSKAVRNLRQLWLYRNHAPSGNLNSALLSGPWSVVNFAVHSNALEHPGESLASAAFAPNLRRLEIASFHDSARVWQPLWRSDRFANLKGFGFRTRLNLPSQLSLPDLLSAPWFAGLDRLELAGKGWHDTALIIPDLAGLLRSSRLRALVLERCRFPKEAAPGLLKLPAVPLECLVLGSGCEIGNRALRAILLSPGLAGLRSFVLGSGCENGNAAIEYLLGSPIRNSLRALQLSRCDLDRIVRLARAGCPQLARLTIRTGARADSPALVRAAVDALLDPDAFPRLVNLTLKAHPEVIRTVAKHRGAARLRRLEVRTALTIEDLRLLGESPCLEGLSSLAINWHAFKQLENWREQHAFFKQQFGPRLEDDRGYTQDADP